MSDQHHEAIQQLRSLLQDEKDLYVGNPADEHLLLMYLRFTDYDADKAFEKMKIVYGFKAENNTFYAYKRDGDHYNDILKSGVTQVLDYRDQRGRRIFVVKMRLMSELGLHPSVMAQAEDLWWALALDEPETQQNGVVLILDLAGLSWRMARFFSPSDMRAGSNKSENRPVKHVQYHLINGGFLINAFMAVVQPFLSQETKEQMYFHKNYESLHTQISPKCLPVGTGEKNLP